MYIVQFQNPDHEPDRIFAENVEKTFDFFMRRPFPGQPPASSSNPAEAGLGAAPKLNLAFPQIVAAYDPKRDPREPLLTPEEMKVYVETFRRTGFTGGINWYRNMTRNWQRAEGMDYTVRVPSLMIMAENDAVLPTAAADGME